MPGAHGGVDDAFAAGSPQAAAAGSIAGPGVPGSGTGSPGGAGGSPTANSASWTSGLELLGIGGQLFDRSFRALPVMISTTGVGVAWSAFFMFGKRRRDGDPPAPDEVLAAHAAAADPVARTVDLIPGPSYLPPGVDPNEAGMPRWRRPSLLEARKADPIRNPTAVTSQTFAHSDVRPDEGMERRRIRYRVVRLMDVPDQLRANEIGILDEGDEVQLLEKSGTYWLVMCPDGQQGWLHQMVLGEVVGVGDAEASPALAPEGIDSDVLSAFLTTRQKTA